VTFAEGDLRELAVDQPFDAAVGRLVLLYLGDPVTAIRRVAGSERPGGVVGFQDLDFSMLPSRGWPPAPQLRMDVALEGGPDFAGYQYIANTVPARCR
jgi:hypothetical protein